MKQKVITDNTVETIKVKHSGSGFGVVANVKDRGEGKQPFGYSVIILSHKEALVLADFIMEVLNGK